MIRTYRELLSLTTFEDRFEYLKLGGVVGEALFGFERYLNQNFYRSAEWRRIRRDVIIRDNGCDLACDGYIIYGAVFIHHMNPISRDDLLKRTDLLLNPDYLISVSFTTHQAIHYGNTDMLPKGPVERLPNDTCPWRTNKGV